MIHLFRWMLLHELKKNYPSRKFILLQILSTFALVWVYYMTAKTIAVRSDIALNWYGFDYFHFLVSGEIALLLAEAATAAHARVISLSLHTKLNWEILRLHWTKSLGKFTVLSLSTLNVAGLEFLLLAACAAFFQSQISAGPFLIAVIYILLSLPCFIILGIGVGAVVLATGRGKGLLNQVMFLLQVLAGVYFPVEILGGWSSHLKLIIPQAYLVHGARQILSGQADSRIWLDLLIYQACFALIFLPISLYLYHWAQLKVRKNSPPILVY